MRSAAHSRRRNASGTWTRIPAPSPVSGSQPHAPRWVRFWRTVSPFSMMSCERSPFTLTTKPTPAGSGLGLRSKGHRGLGSCMLGSPRVRVALTVAPRALAGRGRRRLGGMEGELHALGVRRENHHGLGPRHAVERADLADQALERRGVRRLHLEQQRVLAGHVVALEHVAERGHLALEVADPARVCDQHPDEGGDVETDPARVQDGAVAGHDAGGLELLDALEHRGGTQTHLLSDANERRPAVLLEQHADAEVYVVQLEVGMVTESHKVGGGLAGTFRWGEASLSIESSGNRRVPIPRTSGSPAVRRPSVVQTPPGHPTREG